MVVRKWKSLLLLVFVVTLLPVAAIDRIASADERIELVRDRWGVPHVLADTDAGAMFGLGYVTAEDRGFQMHYTVRIMRGRLAETIGDVGRVRRRETAVQNDRKMRTFGFARAADQLVERLDDDSRRLLQAYSDGVNVWFREHRGSLHELYAKVGLEPEPWTPADSLLCWWHVAQFFATDGTRDLIQYRNLADRPPNAQGIAATRGGRPAIGLPRTDLEPLPPDESTAVVGREDVSDDWLERVRQWLRQRDVAPPGDETPASGTETAPKFSHAWVAGGGLTGTGAAVLVSEPRTPVSNPSLFYEFHVRGQSLDARGIGVAGSPILLIGWNRHVAWGMTALGADQADLFRLKTDTDHPDQYSFDGQWQKMQVIREEIRVRGARPQTLVIRQTRFGPVINEFAFARTEDPPVALKRIPICETDRDTIQGALAMMRAHDVHEFYAALADWRFPSANVVFGDDRGNIGFSLAGALVQRSPLAPNGGGAAHDGSASKFDWRGVIPHELVPHTINPQRGFVFSANHRPIGSF
ncbi:MAG: penicillin acylase family protein, partial [Planctomycetes bacterium]|nr:penicillin acylase family protein [Planctomycetota bacterium]